MRNLVADGALHQHEVELVLLVIHRVFLAGLSADDAHGRVGQDGLEGRGGNTIRTAGSGPTKPTSDKAALLKLKVQLSVSVSLSVVLKPFQCATVGLSVAVSNG